MHVCPSLHPPACGNGWSPRRTPQVLSTGGQHDQQPPRAAGLAACPRAAAPPPPGYDGGNGGVLTGRHGLEPSPLPARRQRQRRRRQLRRQCHQDSEAAAPPAAAFAAPASAPVVDRRSIEAHTSSTSLSGGSMVEVNDPSIEAYTSSTRPPAKVNWNADVLAGISYTTESPRHSDTLAPQNASHATAAPRV